MKESTGVNSYLESVQFGIGQPSESELACLARARMWESMIPFAKELEEAFEEEPVNKYERRRQKLIAEGRCPHCGKPCAPFVECEERRAYKRAKAKERSLVHKKSGEPGDKRFLPRKKKYDYDWRVVVANGGI